MPDTFICLSQITLFDTHRHVASIDQIGVIGRPVPHPIDAIRFAWLVGVFAHLLRKKLRIYAAIQIVIRGATPPAARNRPAIARQTDLCNNAA
ncbi:hypothetical protein [Burkholderia ubonensis]|uniref:hypothetical protein n=1 Tax=Burkholderia ubonensis TaxID=101571 RepID=UPI0012F86F1E|nr:hypothetical protein [Burkholderia ubonensis]